MFSLLRKLTTFITAITLLLYVSGWLINYRDADPSPEYIQLMQIRERLKPIAAEGNALLYMAGFGAEKTSDILTEGRKWLSLTSEDNYQTPVNFGEVINPKYVKAFSCHSEGCLLDKQEIKNYVNQINELFPSLLERYQQLQTYDFLVFPYEKGLLSIPLPPNLTSLGEAQQLHLLSLFDENISLDEKLQKLTVDYQFWLKMLKSSNHALISKIFLLHIETNLFYGHQLKKHNPQMSLPEEWKTPLSFESLNIPAIMLMQAHTYFSIVDITEETKQARFLTSLLLAHTEEQDSKNYIAENAMNIINFYSQRPVTDSKDNPKLIEPNWWNLRNLIGKHSYKKTLPILYRTNQFSMHIYATESYRKKFVKLKTVADD